MTTNDAYFPSVPLPPAGQRDWLAEARLAYGQGDGQRAIYAAREAISVDGSNAAAWAIRARASSALGHYDDAEFEARETVRLAPHIAESHEILGGVLEIKRRYGEALREYETAIGLAPHRLDARVGVVSVYSATDRTQEAVRLAGELSAADPDDEPLRFLLARTLRNDAESRTTQLPDDRHVITSLEQIALVRGNATRALALQFTDSELRDDLRSLNAQADQAERRRWTRTEHPLAYFITIFVTFISAVSCLSSAESLPFSVLSFALFAGAIWLFVHRHHKQNWQYAAALVGDVVRAGR